MSGLLALAVNANKRDFPFRHNKLGGNGSVPHVHVPRLDVNVGGRTGTQVRPKEGRTWGTKTWELQS
jgi:hypothetical protein